MRQPFPISLVRIFRLESQSSYVVKQFIHSTADTQYNDSDKADKQTCTGQSRCAEGGYRCIVWSDVHGFHNQQVIVE